jgi:hypothetical protein
MAAIFILCMFLKTIAITLITTPIILSALVALYTSLFPRLRPDRRQCAG